MRTFITTAAALAIAIGSTTACATKKFVSTQVGQVSTKVDSLSTTLEETQERTRRNEARIGEVDQAAKSAAGQAGQAAQAAQVADTKAVAAGESAKAALERAETIEKSSRRIVYEVTLSEDSGNFKFGQAVLPDEAKAKLDEMIGKLLADPKGAYFEIEGHTDNVGDKNANERLGMARADTVKRYLYEQHKIPLHRMNVISYGEDKPVTGNKTRDERAQNRRVVIKVLA